MPSARARCTGSSRGAGIGSTPTRRGEESAGHGGASKVLVSTKETEDPKAVGTYKEDAFKAAEEELLVERKRRLLRRTRPRHLVDQAEMRRLQPR